MKKVLSAIHLLILLAVCLIGIIECLYGVFQLIGICQRVNPIYPLTGHFSNPGPYGGFIAMVLSVAVPLYFKSALFEKRLVSNLSAIVSFVTIVIGFFVLFSTFSRAAWLSLFVSLSIFAFWEKGLRHWIERHKLPSIFLLVVICILISVTFILKKDSAIGRLHIWNIELRAMRQAPLTGYGRGTVLGVYGEMQAAYFEEGERPKIITKVAGCPEYAFNEYFKIGIESGIPAMLGVFVILLLFVLVLLRLMTPLAYLLVSLSVFAFFSYPFESIHCPTENELEWEDAKELMDIGLYDEAVASLEPLYDVFSDNFRYLYDYGYSLYRCQNFSRSVEVLGKGASISSDPMFNVIIGRCYESVGLYNDAEREYMHAHFMVPQRLYPLILLMRMHTGLGNNQQALNYAYEILSQDINRNHPIMLSFQDEASSFVDSMSKHSY